jgi:N-acetylglucosaminyldiphosphoundecaprenol N-acetyl-beta-D-mannosaminyltransferase
MVIATDVQTVRVLGSRVHLLSTSQTVDQIEDWVKANDRRCRRVTVAGFHGLSEADKSPKMHKILNGAELWVPDGIVPVLAARLSGHRKVQRAPGMDIMLEFFRRANEKGYSSYFYGSTEATLAALYARVQHDYPRHRIVGLSPNLVPTDQPPKKFSPSVRPLTLDEDQEIVERINAARPDVLWVGLGAPKQEVWMHERLDRLKVPVAVGVGAAFAFLGGTVRRCPDWIGRMGFEWAYRLIKEPKKLWRRDLIEGPSFLFRLGLDLTGLRRNAAKESQVRITR